MYLSHNIDQIYQLLNKYKMWIVFYKKDKRGNIRNVISYKLTLIDIELTFIDMNMWFYRWIYSQWQNQLDTIR
jgi:hypothetical protein